jgi:hypothetical protein
MPQESEQIIYSIPYLKNDLTNHPLSGMKYISLNLVGLEDSFYCERARIEKKALDFDDPKIFPGNDFFAELSAAKIYQEAEETGIDLHVSIWE